MIITYNGQNYLKLQSGDTAVLVDPTDQRSFRGADVIINTRKPAEVEDPEDENTFWIDHAGEYEVKGIRINGWQSESNDIEKTIYRLEFDGLKIAILGFLEKTPDEKLQEHLTNLDIVIAPAGGKDIIKPSEIAKFIRQLEPALIIPSVTEKSDEFLKEFNEEKCKKEEKIVLRQSDLTEGEMEVRCLKAT